MTPSDGSSANGALSPRARLAHRLRPRHWSIVLAVLGLHLRFVRFHPRLLTRLERGTLRPVMHLSRRELRLAERWNRRIGDRLQGLGAPYTRCMKRALVAALLLERRVGLDLVIGVRADDALEGHAWLELHGEVVSQRFDHHEARYIEVRRLPIAPVGGR